MIAQTGSNQVTMTVPEAEEHWGVLPTEGKLRLFSFQLEVATCEGVSLCAAHADTHRANASLID